MANNVQVLDAVSATQTMKTTDNAGVHTPHHNVDKLLSVSATGQATMANSLPVVQASDTPGVTTSLEASGNLGALNDAVTIDLKHIGGAAFQVPAGTFSGTIAVEVSLDNTNWVGAQWSTPTSTTVSTTFTQASLPLVGLCMSSGFRYFRLRVSSYTSGSTTAIVRASAYSYNSNIAPANFINDNAGFTDGTSKVIPAGFIFDEVAGTALTENDGGAARMDSKRALVVGIEDRTTRGQRTAVDASGNLAVAPKAAATGGATIGKVLSAASTNATNLKASAGKVIDIALVNTNAAVRYLHLYNKASAPTVGTDVPVATIAIPGNAAGAGISIPSNIGLDFSTGISYSLTTGPADTDAVAVALNEITGWITYK